MFESAELGHKVDDQKYKKEVKSLREELLSTQFDVLEAKSFPVIVLMNGVDRLQHDVLNRPQGVARGDGTGLEA